MHCKWSLITLEAQLKSFKVVLRSKMFELSGILSLFLVITYVRTQEVGSDCTMTHTVSATKTLL
jgi:hypothetical protein